MMRRNGVLIVGFGGPDSIEAVRPFMCELMGREPSDELVEDVCMRYLAIGGASPLPLTADALALALSEELEETPVLVGMRYSAPSIVEATERFLEAGVERIIVVALSPFESKVTLGAYREAVAEALEGHPEIEVVEAPLIGTLDAFAELVAAGCVSALEQLDPPQGALVVFTAHSLPVADLTDDDPYVGGLRSTVDRVVEFLGYEPGMDGIGSAVLEGISTYGSLVGKQPWVMAYQSKGTRPGEWLGPDLDDVIDAAAKAEIPSLVAVPVGFVTDHLETLYDLDIMAADRALTQDMEFVRAPVPNEHEHLVKGIAESVKPLL